MMFRRAASGWTTAAEPSPLPGPRNPHEPETAVLRFTSAGALMRDATPNRIVPPDEAGLTGVRPQSDSILQALAAARPADAAGRFTAASCC